jgi:hypothetical protein
MCISNILFGHRKVTKGFVTHVFLLLPGRGKQATSRYFLLIEIRFIAIRTNTNFVCVCKRQHELDPPRDAMDPRAWQVLVPYHNSFFNKTGTQGPNQGGWIEIKTSAAEFSTPPEIK